MGKKVKAFLWGSISLLWFASMSFAPLLVPESLRYPVFAFFGFGFPFAFFVYIAISSD